MEGSSGAEPPRCGDELAALGAVLEAAWGTCWEHGLRALPQLALQLEAAYLTLLCLRFLICKTGAVTAPAF